MTEKMSDFMTVKQAAEHLGIDLSAVYLAVRRGAIQSTRDYGVLLLYRASVAEYKPRENAKRKSPRHD